MKILLKTVLSISVLTCSFAYALNQPHIFNPDQLTWKPANGLAGAEVAVLSGNPERHEPFIARVKLPANFEVPVHQHNIVENETVISGVLYLGVGSTFDKTQAQALQAGSFVMIPAKLKHYSWTQQETILQVSGVGPWGMVYKHPVSH